MSKASTILRKALGVLYLSGWIKNTFGDTRSVDGPHCALGAVRVVQNVRGDEFNYNDFEKAVEYLNSAVRGGGYTDVALFNDSAYTTFDDVEKVYNLAIKKADGLEF